MIDYIDDNKKSVYQILKNTNYFKDNKLPDDEQSFSASLDSDDNYAKRLYDYMATEGYDDSYDNFNKYYRRTKPTSKGTEIADVANETQPSRANTSNIAETETPTHNNTVKYAKPTNNNAHPVVQSQVKQNTQSNTATANAQHKQTSKGNKQAHNTQTENRNISDAQRRQMMIGNVAEMQQNVQNIVNFGKQRVGNMQRYGFGLGTGGVKKDGYQYNAKTRKMEQAYLTPNGTRTTSKQTAQAEVDELKKSKKQQLGLRLDEKSVNDLQKSSEGVIVELWKEAEKQYNTEIDKNNKDFAGRPWYYAEPGERTVDIATNRQKNEVSRLKNFDLKKMSDRVWAKTGENLTERCYKLLANAYKGAPGAQLYASAKAMARQLSDNAVYRYAVKKNAPKSTLDYLGKMVQENNLLNSLSVAAARTEAGTTGDLSAKEQAMNEYGEAHPWQRVAGTVLGMASDPTTYLGGYAGNLVARGTLGLTGRLLFGRLANNAGARLVGSTLGGRVLSGVAGGAGNMATYEGVKEAENQLKHGGYINPETGQNEGFSVGQMLKAAGHGAIIGSATGVVSPLLGNVADKVVKATSNTAGKVGARAGELALSTVAEGTIFATPEWIANAKLEENDPNKKSGWDIWTNSMGTMLGFKAMHAVKAAPKVIADLRPIKNPRTIQERNHNRMKFLERLRNRLNASPKDMAFTNEEREELVQNGYGGLASLFAMKEKQMRRNPAISDFNVATFENPKGVEVSDEGRAWLKNHPEIDGYDTMEEFMQDGNISQSARAKAYYIFTGRHLPMGTVMGCTKEIDENGNIYIKSITSYGEVVTNKRVANEDEAQREQDKIMRQVELNTIDVGESMAEQRADNMMWNEAVQYASPGADPETVRKNYQSALAGDENAQKQFGDIFNKIDEFYERNGNIADSQRPEFIRKEISEKTGVDVDEAIRKVPEKRTEEEQKAVQEYAERLYPENNKEAEPNDRAGIEGPEDNSHAPNENQPKEPGPTENNSQQDNAEGGFVQDEQPQPAQTAPADPVQAEYDRQKQAVSDELFTDLKDKQLVYTDPQTGQECLWKATYHGQDYYIVKQNRVQESSPSHTVSYNIYTLRDEQGGTIVINSLDLDLRFDNPVPLDQMADQALAQRGITPESIQKQIDFSQSHNPQTKVLSVGDTYTDPDGTKQIVVGEADGKLIVRSAHFDTQQQKYTEDPKSPTRELTPEQVAAEQDAYYDALDQQTPTTQTPEPEEKQETDNTPVEPEQPHYTKPSQNPEPFGPGDQLTFYIDNKPIQAEVVQPENEDGVVIETSQRVNGHKVYQYTREELDQLTTPPEAKNEEPNHNEPQQPKNTPEQTPTTQTTNNELPPYDGDKFNQTHTATETGTQQPQQVSSDANLSPQNDNKENETKPQLVSPSDTQTPQPTTGSALSRIPQDENGEPLYTQTDPKTAWNALLEQAEGDTGIAKEVATSMLSDLKAELKQSQKQKPTGGKTVSEKIQAQKEHKANIDRIQNEVDKWQEILNQGEKKEEPKENTIPTQDEAPQATVVRDEAPTPDHIADDSKKVKENTVAQNRADNQGNPLNEDGTLKVAKVKSIDEITDKDFNSPTRNVELPKLPQIVDDAIGTNGKPMVIKKNIFEKNKRGHKDLTPQQSRQILHDALFETDLYGQNQKTSRPYNWILIHNADKHSSVIVEVNHNKDNTEIVNWHYLDDVTLERKKRQAVREGGLILTLESAAADTHNGLSSESKDTTSKTEEQEKSKENKEEDAATQPRQENGAENANPEKVSPEQEAEQKAYDKWKRKDEKNLRKQAEQLYDEAFNDGYVTPEIIAAQTLASVKITPESLRAHTGFSKAYQRKYVGMIAKKENGGISFDQAVEMAETAYREANNDNDNVDFYDMRSIVEDIIREGNLRGYEKRFREQQIKQTVDALKAERDKAFDELYGTDYDTYMQNPQHREEELSYTTKSKKQSKENTLQIPAIENDPLGPIDPDAVVPFHKTEQNNTTQLTPEETLLRDTIVERLEEAGIPVSTDTKEGQALLDLANGKGDVKLEAKRKRALETASLGENPRSLTVISSADGANVLKKIDVLTKELEEISTQPKTFIGDVAKALGAKRFGSGSEYATFETKNGQIVTIRLANHNAHTSGFDHHNKHNGISIVISPKGNNGITNDGNAHIVEFYYDSIKLRRAEGKPLAEIVQSIKQALYSGEFKDTTGLAERQEVNEQTIREHRVYHGSGADFDHFDHSHMGEGEGAQAYGWGTYVTEVKGIGRTYASRFKRNVRIRDISSIEKRVKEDNRFADLSKEEIHSLVSEAEKYVQSSFKDYGNLSDENILIFAINEAQFDRRPKVLVDVLRSIKVEDLEDAKRHLYTVEIPDDNGENYIDYNGKISDMPSQKIDAICAELEKLGWKRKDLPNAVRFTDGYDNIEINPDATGADLYEEITAASKSPKQTSKLLSRAGFVGIKYPADYMRGGRSDNAQNYVIFNEKDAKITDHIRFFRTPDGQAYGYTVGGKIYIDPTIARADTPIHEYTHLWAEALRQANHKEWENIISLMKDLPLWNEIRKRYPELKTDSEIADEVLAHYSGVRGAERLREEQEKIKNSNQNLTAKARALAAIEKVRQALNRFWKQVADFLHIHYTSAEQVADQVMKDMLNGVNPKMANKGKTLAGVHNISEDKLLKALKLGGLANPSMAVIDTAKSTHTGYGEISLIAPSSLVDKRTGKNAGTFYGDAWTPTYPTVEKYIPEQSQGLLEKDLDSLPREMYGITRNAIDSLVEGGGADGLAYMYLHERGMAPELVRLEGKYPKRLQEHVKEIIGRSTFSQLSDTDRQKIVELYIQHQYQGDRKAFLHDMSTKKQKWQDFVTSHPKSSIARDKQMDIDYISQHGYDYDTVSKFAGDVLRDTQNQGRISDSLTSQKALRDIEAKKLTQDFEQWKQELKQRYGVQERIFDGYTPSGKPKYVPNDLEHVSRKMKQQGRNGATGILPTFGSFVGSALQANGNLSNIRQNKHRLTNEHKDLEEFEEQWKPTYEHLAEVLNPKPSGTFDDTGYLRLQELANQKDPKGYVLKEYGITLTDKDVSDLNNMIKAIRDERPAMYFETKFERPVTLNEFKAAVVPNDADPRVVEGLKQSGLNIFTYDPTVKDDRQRATNQAMQSSEDIRFQKVGEPYDYDKYPRGKAEPNLADKEINIVQAKADNGFKNYAEAKDWAKKNIARTYDNEETGGKGNIRISNTAIGKFLSKSAVDKSESKDAHLSVLRVLPEVIRESVDAETHPDFNKDSNEVRSAENSINKNVLMHRLYGAVGIDGKVYRVKVTLKEEQQNKNLPQKAYSYEATKIELLTGTLGKPEDDAPRANNSITGAKLLKDVEMSYDPGKKLLDESKKNQSDNTLFRTLKEERQRMPFKEREIKTNNLISQLKDSVKSGLKNKSRRELEETFRTLCQLNSMAVKGYGSLAEYELKLNSRIYTVKHEIMKPLADALYDNGADVSYVAGVLYLRNSEGIQMSLHTANPSLPNDDFSGVPYLDRNAKWDGIFQAFNHRDPAQYKTEVAKRRQAESIVDTAKQETLATMKNMIKSVLKNGNTVRSLYGKTKKEIHDAIDNAPNFFELQSVLPKDYFTYDRLQRRTYKEAIADGIPQLYAHTIYGIYEFLMQSKVEKMLSDAKLPYKYDYKNSELAPREDNGVIYMRDQEPITPSSDPKDMADTARSLGKQLGEEVEVVTDPSQITDSNPVIQERKRKAKGWFDRKTGKVVVNLSTHKDTADVAETILHETVGHKGLRALVGEENFNQFLDNIYEHASNPVRQAIDNLSQRKGYSKHTATEEYMAGLAENGFNDRLNASLWHKIKQWFSDMLAKAKTKLNFNISDRELKYQLWKSYQLRRNKGKENIIDRAKDISMQAKLRVGNNSDLFRNAGGSHDTAVVITKHNETTSGRENLDTLFRDADDPVDYERALVRDSYERRMRSAIYQMREAMQDRYLSLKKTMEDIWKASGKTFKQITDIPAYQNPYLGLVALSSVNEKEVEQFHRQLFKPLLKEMLRLAPTADDRAKLTDYMMAKHGLERNILMAERNAKIEFEQEKKRNPQTTKTLQYFIDENRKKDFSGLTALTEKNNVADAENEAKQMVTDYESKHNTSELWKLTKAVTDSIIQKQYETGYIDNNTRKQLQKMYKNYIPLRGFKDRTAEDVYSYMRHSNSGFSAPIKTARGRKSKADDPFANMVAMAESGILRGNRNQLVKLPLLNLVQEHPTDLISLSDVWLKLNHTLGEWETVAPGDVKGTKAIDEDDTPEEIERKIKTFNGIMKGLAQEHPDKYRKQADAPDIPYRVVKTSSLTEHQIIITRNGKDYTITINANPRLAQTVNGIGNPDNIDNIVKKTTRYLSQIYTQLSIDFATANFTRDTIYSNISAHIKEGRNYGLHYNINFIKNVPRMYKLYYKYKRGTLGDTGIEKKFKDFIAHGGETGYYILPDMEKRKRDIEKEIKQLNGKITPRKAFNWLKEFIDYFNKTAENTARFTAFQTSRTFGRSITHAIQNAKDISVNFNTKGAGTQFLHNKEEKRIAKAIAILAKYGQEYLPFFNAAIQGTTNFASMAKHHPKASATVITTLITLSATVALMGTTKSGDEDDDEYNYYNIPSYVRRNNITFRVGHKTYITIPLPVEYRIFYGLGELMTSSFTGAERLSSAELTKEVFSLFSQALPIDFAEEGDAVSKFLPGMIKPIWEVRENKSWTGLPIYKDNVYNKNTPEYLSVYSNTNQQLVELSKFLNDITGGDTHKRGELQINPAAVEYLLSSYLGGLYTLSNRLTKTAETITGTREFNPNSVPVINRFIKQPDERTAYRQINTEYEKIKDDAEALDALLNNYNKDTRNGVADYAKKIRTINYSPEYRYMLIYQGIQPHIEKLKKKLKDEDGQLSDKEIEALEYSIQGLKKLIVDRVRYEQDHKSSKPIVEPFLDDNFKNKWVNKHPQSKKVFNELSKEEKGNGNNLGSVYQQYASDNDRRLDIQVDRLADKLTDSQKKNEDVKNARKEYNKSIRSFNELIDNNDAKPTDYKNALQSIRTDRMEYIKAMIKAKLSSKR